MAVLASVQDRYESLTTRERQVFGLVTAGLMNKQMAGRLEISEKWRKFLAFVKTLLVTTEGSGKWPAERFGFELTWTRAPLSALLNCLQSGCQAPPALSSGLWRQGAVVQQDWMARSSAVSSST
ncbi:hypothetical protein FFR93_21880 [Rhizobium sp. MHM7A]|nr:hypothetical protein FFR93_21880 [Rhizobium sp. MHM7A]